MLFVLLFNNSVLDIHFAKRHPYPLSNGSKVIEQLSVIIRLSQRNRPANPNSRDIEKWSREKLDKNVSETPVLLRLARQFQNKHNRTFRS